MISLQYDGIDAFPPGRWMAHGLSLLSVCSSVCFARQFASSSPCVCVCLRVAFIACVLILTDDGQNDWIFTRTTTIKTGPIHHPLECKSYSYIIIRQVLPPSSINNYYSHSLILSHPFHFFILFFLLIMTTTATATGKAPTYTLYAAGASFRAFATLVAAEYGGIDVRVSTDGASAAAAKSPVGKLPVLEVSNHGGDGDDDGGVDGDGTGAETTTAVIFGSHAMARYVGSLRRDVGLMGRSALETALIDGWMDYAAQELELPACVWFYPVVGYMPFNAVA